MDMKKMERWSGQGTMQNGEMRRDEKKEFGAILQFSLAASLFGRTCSLNCTWATLQIQKRSKFRAIQKTIRPGAPFMKKQRCYTLHYNKLRRLECTGINLFLTVVSDPFWI